MFEKAKGLWDGAYGKGQHVLTARCLVGIGNRYMFGAGMGNKYQKGNRMRCTRESVMSELAALRAVGVSCFFNFQQR